MSEKKVEFKPYISANKIVPELTSVAIVLGIVMSVVFGAANAYLGLRVGLTVSASIPAAVVSMGIVRVLMRRDSILENNIVQTISSAGESLAAGAIFTLPALFMWAETFGWENPSLTTITFVSLFAGGLGVLFMIPLRKMLIVKEHQTLPYPEGTACAEILKAGEKGGAPAKFVFGGLLFSGFFSFLMKKEGASLFSSTIFQEFKSWKGAAFGIQASPALLGVGFILGPSISYYMFAGALMSWGIINPLIAMIGTHLTVPIYPASFPISDLSASQLWSHYVRYVGVGAVACGGIVSLIKAIPLIIDAFGHTLHAFKERNRGDQKVIPRTNRDISTKMLLGGIGLLILAIGFSPVIPVGIVGAILIAFFGFLFATVSSRLVGLVGSSSNPVSGMTIATLILTAVIFKSLGIDGQTGMISALLVGAIVCMTAAIAGDTSQDLKTGYLLGASPYKQQIGEMIGVVSAALAIGGVLILLNKAYGFGTEELAAPQAVLMQSVIDGVMNHNLPWPFVIAGFTLGLCMLLMKIPILPVAVGLYLPIYLTTTIMAGALIRAMLERKARRAVDAQKKTLLENRIKNGVLTASGLIAGEGFVGIILAALVVFASVGGRSYYFGPSGSWTAFLLLAAFLYFFNLSSSQKRGK